jgi:hypothetical protein
VPDELLQGLRRLRQQQQTFVATACAQTPAGATAAVNSASTSPPWTTPGAPSSMPSKQSHLHIDTAVPFIHFLQQLLQQKYTGQQLAASDVLPLMAAANLCNDQELFCWLNQKLRGVKAGAALGRS